MKRVEKADTTLTRTWANHHRRFRRKYYIAENGCWEWMGGRNRFGYGSFNIGRITFAHRASWILHESDIPSDMLVLHKCDNPGCVNPKHLFIGTNQDNTRDAVKKGRHKLDRNRTIPLFIAWTDDLRIREAYMKFKIPVKKIAMMYKVSHNTISEILLCKPAPRYIEAYKIMMSCYYPGYFSGDGEGI